jgi:hypothetical protein
LSRRPGVRTGTIHAFLRIVESAAAALRLAEARAFVESHLDTRTAAGILIVSASRGAADDLARSVAASRPATIGLHRFSFTQLAARMAAPVLAAQGLAPATYLGTEAVAARAAFDVRKAEAFTYFGPVAQTPGFPRALGRTLQELRLAEVREDDLARLPLGGPDLSALLERFDEQFAAAAATDRATLFRAAVEGAHAIDLPLLLLDVPCDSPLEFDFLRAAVAASRDVLMTVPFGDMTALDRLRVFGVEPVVLEQKGDADLVALRRHLFASSRPPTRDRQGDVTMFSAPGEGRESVEIVRRILDESRRGVPFDEMAVLLRSSRNYLGLLEHAFARAGVPAWFDRGIRRPHPAGGRFSRACVRDRQALAPVRRYLSLAQCRIWAPSLRVRPTFPHKTKPSDRWPRPQRAHDLTTIDRQKQRLESSTPRRMRPRWWTDRCERRGSGRR